MVVVLTLKDTKKGLHDAALTISFGEGLVLGVDDGLVDSIPTGSGDTPVVRGVLVSVDADFSSFHLFVSIDTHDVYVYVVYYFDYQFVTEICIAANVWQRYDLFLFCANFFSNKT